MLVLHEDDIAVKGPGKLSLVEKKPPVFELGFVVGNGAYFPVALIKDQDGVFFAISRLISLGKMEPEIAAVIDIAFVSGGIPGQLGGPHPFADLAVCRLHRRRSRVIIDDSILRIKHLLPLHGLREQADQKHCRKPNDRSRSFHD